MSSNTILIGRRILTRTLFPSHSEEEKSKINLTLTDRRLSRRLSLAGDGSKDLNLEFDVNSVKVKSNREVDMINKWREVDRAHEDLEHIRVAHLKKLKQFEV